MFMKTPTTANPILTGSTVQRRARAFQRFGFGVKRRSSITTRLRAGLDAQWLQYSRKAAMLSPLFQDRSPRQAILCIFSSCRPVMVAVVVIVAVRVAWWRRFSRPGPYRKSGNHASRLAKVLENTYLSRYFVTQPNALEADRPVQYLQPLFAEM